MIKSSEIKQAKFIYWFKVLISLLIFTSVIYILLRISDMLVVRPELMDGTHSLELVSLCASIFSLIFKTYYYLFLSTIFIWVIFGVISIFL